MYQTINASDSIPDQLLLRGLSVDLEKVRNSVESSTKCPTVQLKADTGADVNLMNSMTFDSLFNRNRKVLDPTSLRMKAYGNSTVEVLGKVP